jgi:hypothetical protein
MNAPVSVNIENPPEITAAMKVPSDETTFVDGGPTPTILKKTTETNIVQKSSTDDQKHDNDEAPSTTEASDKEKAIKKSTSCTDLDLPSPESEEDEEIKLAMEMAIAAAKNPHLSPSEIQRLVGEKNAQAKMIDEFSKQNGEKIKMNQLKVKELQRQRSSVTSTAVASSWWNAAAKKAEEIKDRAERSLYAEQISKDEAIIETRKTMKILKKTLKAHRLQGNRVETRHVFKRQRMEKRLIQSNDKLKKTQQIFTNSNYNVQEYLKAMMRASKKWRKMGSDEELLLEAQLSRNMHQMLALEKQKVKCKKNTKEMKKYLQRCKGWLSDKKAFCEMNIMTIDATQNSIMRLYEETLRRQDKLIAKYKASDEFINVDLLSVDLSHIKFPKLSYVKDAEQSKNELAALRGLPIVDSIRVTKEHIDRAAHHAGHSNQADQIDDDKSNDQAKTRQQLLNDYYKQQQEQQQNSPELYVVANKDDESISSRLSDPDASFNGAVDEVEESEDGEQFGDAPWNHTNRSRFNSTNSGDNDSANGCEHTLAPLEYNEQKQAESLPCSNFSDGEQSASVVHSDDNVIELPSE